MSVHLVAVTASGGVPLFCRSIGEEVTTSVPYSTLAALNGVNFFSRLNGVNLMSCGTDNSKIQWKVFNDSLVLIMIVKNMCRRHDFVSESVISRTIDYIHDGLILTCGPNDIINFTNVERLKKSAKKSFNLIDHFLRAVLNETSHVNLQFQSSNLVNTDEEIDSDMRRLVDSFSNIAQSDFACLVANQSIVSASKSWLSKFSGSKDSFLLINLVNSLPKEFFDEVQYETGSKIKIKEICLFLPENAPDTVTRVVIVNLFIGVYLILLVGASPSIDEIKLWSASSIELITASIVHQHQLKILSGLQNFRGTCLLPLDERINHVLMINHDVNIVFRYGHHLDRNKMNDFQIVFNQMLTKSAFPTPHEQPDVEEIIHLTHGTVYRTSSRDMTLIICVARDVKMSLIESLSTRTSCILREKKMIPNLRHH